MKITNKNISFVSRSLHYVSQEHVQKILRNTKRSDVYRYMAHTMMAAPGMGQFQMSQMQQMAQMQHIAPAPIARSVVPQSTTAPPAFDKAVGYVTRIKERFQDDDSKTYVFATVFFLSHVTQITSI